MLAFATLKATVPDYIFPKCSGVSVEDQPAMGEQRVKVVISKWVHITTMQTSLTFMMVLWIALDHGQAVYSVEGWHKVLRHVSTWIGTSLRTPYWKGGGVNQAYSNMIV